MPLPGIGEDNADEILIHYNNANFPTWNAAFSALVTDAFFTCGAELMADTNHGGEPAYQYHYTLAAPFLGSFHGIEISYVFGWGIIPELPFLPADQALSDNTQSAWTSFAADGSPRFSKGWSAYNSADPNIAIFDHTLESVASIRNGRCTLLRTRTVVVRPPATTKVLAGHSPRGPP